MTVVSVQFGKFEITSEKFDDGKFVNCNGFVTLIKFKEKFKE